jgi:glycosyltransferase involved in cell wall biosynthesis
MQPLVMPLHSLVIPVYRNADSIPNLLTVIGGLYKALNGQLETLFVVDGSPDHSHALLEELLPATGLRARVILLSRNFGAFAAIRCGLEHARGDYIAVMAADLQEPPELILEFFSALHSKPIDVVFGQRLARSDPGLGKFASRLFWWLYRKFVQPDVPAGGVDIFAITASFRDRLIRLSEANSSLLGLLFWMGGRRLFIGYERRERQHGKSAWTLKKKITYLLDSIFAFSDLPVRVLMAAGLFGLVLAIGLAGIVLIMRLASSYVVPGYAGTMLTILFFGALNTFGIGIIGNYAWRAYENTKQRPLNIVLAQTDYPGSRK